MKPKNEITAITKAYQINPVPKPRMTRQDKWPNPPKGYKGEWPRPCVQRYRSFKDACRLLGVVVPESSYHVVFVLPMPPSWPKWKREAMNGQPHRQRPDKDNLEKALLDAVYGEDCHVWDGRVSKIWGVEGGFIIRAIDENVDLSWIAKEGF